MVREYDILKAIKYDDLSRVELVNSIIIIFNEYDVLSTDLSISVKELVNFVYSLKGYTHIDDESWLKVLDLYFLFYPFFCVRRAWIESNCFKEFFTIYNDIKNKK